MKMNSICHNMDKLLAKLKRVFVSFQMLNYLLKPFLLLSLFQVLI